MTREEAITLIKAALKTMYLPKSKEYISDLGYALEMAIKALEQEPCEDEYIKVPKKALKYRTAGMVAYNAEWLKNHFDMERTVICGEQEPCEDAISRQAALDCFTATKLKKFDFVLYAREEIKKLPAVNPTNTGHWIPVSERLPEDTDPVNITWVNHDPESYYADIKDKPFTATGHYCNGRWWWYSVTCQDYLDEYGHWDIDAMDDAIEVIAWMPLPKPYEPQESEDKE